MEKGFYHSDFFYHRVTQSISQRCAEVGVILCDSEYSSFTSVVKKIVIISEHSQQGMPGSYRMNLQGWNLPIHDFQSDKEHIDE